MQFKMIMETESVMVKYLILKLFNRFYEKIT